MLLVPSAFSNEPTTLTEMLAKVQTDSAVTLDTLPLSRDWIGDITDDEGKIERLRLEKGRITKGEIFLLRTYPNGSYLSDHAPVYVKSIPANDKLRSCKSVAELKEMIGHGQPGFDLWGDRKGLLHGAHSWVCFSPTAENRLTYIDVFAHTVSNEQMQGTMQVDQLLIRRGEMRPADSENQNEQAIYLSGADAFEAEEAKKARERQRYPQPLRELILVDEHPDDSDLKHLSAAIQAIRNNPDPKLFTQLAQEIHEGTLRIRSLLNYILLNGDNLLDLKPWGDKEEAIAVGACIDSLLLVQDDAMDDLVATVLRACGGGKIEIEGKNGGRSIEVTLTKNGNGLALGEASHPLPLKEAQEELRRLYIKSRVKQDGSGQPAARPESK